VTSAIVGPSGDRPSALIEHSASLHEFALKGLWETLVSAVRGYVDVRLGECLDLTRRFVRSEANLDRVGCVFREQLGGCLAVR